LANIRGLRLRFRNITKLPESISNLKRLRYLDGRAKSSRILMRPARKLPEEEEEEDEERVE
ncbi:hypothetical protein ACMD2_09103, partial [Ananas comosus]